MLRACRTHSSGGSTSDTYTLYRGSPGWLVLVADAVITFFLSTFSLSSPKGSA